MILIELFVLIFFIISVPLWGIVWLLGKKDEKLQVAVSQKIVNCFFRGIFFIAGVKVQCEGVDQVPSDEPVVYIANHRSYCDILAGYMTVPTLTGFISKDMLARVPFVRIWMRFLKCLFLDRDNPKEGLKTILQGIEQLKSGYSVFIMPEGTRNQSEHLLPLMPFHEGSFKLATKTGCAIVPVAMKNTDKVVQKNFPWIKPCVITLVYGKPVYADDLSEEERKHVGRYMQQKVKEMLEKME